MANILVIDDDPAACTFAAKVLERDGHTVVHALNGRLGLKLFKEHGAIDVVITDIVMPEQDGLGTIMELHKKHPELPIIAISGGGAQISTDFLSIAGRLGAGQCLEKPCSPEMLRGAVRQALDD